jgi:hypothetical protein
MPGITYSDIEPVTRELIAVMVARQDEYGLVKPRYLDAMFQTIAQRPVGPTQELVRSDIHDALRCFDQASDDGS